MVGAWWLRDFEDQLLLFLFRGKKKTQRAHPKHEKNNVRGQGSSLFRGVKVLKVWKCGSEIRVFNDLIQKRKLQNFFLQVNVKHLRCDFSLLLDTFCFAKILAFSPASIPFLSMSLFHAFATSFHSPVACLII